MAERNSESQKSLETLSAELKEQLVASVPWRGLAVVWRNPKHRAISVSQNKANWEDFLSGFTKFTSFQSYQSLSNTHYGFGAFWARTEMCFDCHDVTMSRYDQITASQLRLSPWKPLQWNRMRSWCPPSRSPSIVAKLHWSDHFSKRFHGDLYMYHDYHVLVGMAEMEAWNGLRLKWFCLQPPTSPSWHLSSRTPGATGGDRLVTRKMNPTGRTLWVGSTSSWFVWK